MKKKFTSDREKVKVAVLGMGRQGQIHSQNIAYKIPEAELVCVSDISKEQKKLVLKV
jgi:ketol-acid reductoisomerase